MVVSYVINSQSKEQHQYQQRLLGIRIPQPTLLPLVITALIKSEDCCLHPWKHM